MNRDPFNENERRKRDAEDMKTLANINAFMETIPKGFDRIENRLSENEAKHERHNERLHARLDEILEKHNDLKSIVQSHEIALNGHGESKGIVERVEVVAEEQKKINQTISTAKIYVSAFSLFITTITVWGKNLKEFFARF